MDSLDFGLCAARCLAPPPPPPPPVVGSLARARQVTAVRPPVCSSLATCNQNTRRSIRTHSRRPECARCSSTPNLNATEHNHHTFAPPPPPPRHTTTMFLDRNYYFNHHEAANCTRHLSGANQHQRRHHDQIVHSYFLQQPTRVSPPQAAKKANRQQHQAHTRTKLFTSNTASCKTMILNSLLLISLCLFAFYRPTSGQYDQLTITQDQPPPPLQPVVVSAAQAPPSTSNEQQQQQHQLPSTITNTVQQLQEEIFVLPNSRVKIECKLPQVVANGSGKFYWNFQRSSHRSNKPDLLCFQTQCFEEAAYGIQLEMDQSSGAYDLLISNATYEMNDGIYYCDYKTQDASTGSRATISREFRLTVLIAPQAPSIAPSSAVPAREGQEFQLNCVSHGGNPEPNITWFRNEQQLVTSAGVRIEQLRQNGSTTSALAWIPTLDDHQATYKCSVHNKAMQGLAPFERDITLPVEFAPRISVGPHNPLRVLQGDKATLSCQVEANPPVKGIRWFLDGRLISNQYNHTLHDVKISDSGLYSCQADNGIAPLLSAAVALANQQPTAASSHGPSGGFLSFLGLATSSNGQQQQQQQAGAESIIKTNVEARLQLEVLYPPRVQVRQSRPMPLAENDYFSLNCSSDSWPQAHEFIWSKQEPELGSTTLKRISSSSSPLLEFNSITASDMGNYTCTAINRLEPSIVSSGAGSGYASSQPMAIERQASASSLVLVKHKPGFAEILIGQGGETELGNKTQFQCRLKPPGYPEPSYKFWRYYPSNPGNRYYLNKLTYEPVYTIYSAKPEDEAKYGCSASNELGVSNEADGELIVNEVPKIISDSARRPEDARPPGDSPYSITVRATGKPEPKVVWYHRSPVDGRRLTLNAPEWTAKFRIETVSNKANEQHQQHHSSRTSGSRYEVVSTLIFKQPLELDDRGLYSVEFNNGLSRSAIEDFQLHIYHAPIPAPRNQPVVIRRDARQQLIEPRLKAGFNLGEVAQLTCRVSAYPKPEFSWFSNSEGGKSLDPITRYRNEVNNTLDDLWESTLSFSMTSEADYNNYMCVTANQEYPNQLLGDSVRQHINLSRKSLPDAPNQLEQVDASQDSVTLQWIPGFDGGFAQNQFIVQYAPEDSIDRRSLSVDLGDRDMASASVNNPAAAAAAGDNNQITSDQQQQQQYPRLFDCFNMNPCTIGNLAPRQTYLMRVRARNELGASEFGDTIRAHTRANVSQVPKILEATFDKTRNMLSFRVEPNPEYLLNNLNAKIEIKTLNSQAGDSNPATTAGANELPSAQTDSSLTSEWRPYTTVPIRQELAEVYLNMPQSIDQLRLTLCSRSSESQCGTEFVVSARSLASSFLQDQRGLSLSIFMLAVISIATLGALATTAHSCCVSRKAKKAADLDRADGHHHHHRNSMTNNGPAAISGNHNVDNKPLGGHTNGGLTLSGKNSHGSTTSTNSTLANGNSNNHNNTTQQQQQQQQQQLQSMDSIHGHLNGAGGGSASDHSSDHSRQAKLDSMLPPNYNHYADRASLMLEQQQQQQQQQQAAYLQAKLGSPFGLPSSALINGQQNSPMAAGLGNQQFAYLNQEHLLHPVSSMTMDETANGAISLQSVLDSNDHLATATDGQQQPQTALWPQHHPSLDDYNNYNTLASYQQQQQQDQMIDPTYGTAASLIMAHQQQQSGYDNNNANNQFSSYLGAPVGYGQQQAGAADSSQYQQEIAAAQQQMYGTLTRNSNNYTTHQPSSNGSAELQSINQQQGLIAPPDHHLQQQQQQLNEQYMATNGLVQAMPPPPPIESDYGTTRGGRLIREIIV